MIQISMRCGFLSAKIPTPPLTHMLDPSLDTALFLLPLPPPLLSYRQPKQVNEVKPSRFPFSNLIKRRNTSENCPENPTATKWRNLKVSIAKSMDTFIVTKWFLKC